MIEYYKKLSANTLIRNYVKVFSVDVLVKGSGIILLPIYLRLMTQEEFGLYGYLAAIINTFSLVFNLGIYTAQSKLYHDYPENKKGSVLFTINLILLVFMIVLLALILVFGMDYPIINFLFKNTFNYSQYRGPVLLGVVVAVYALMLVNFFLTSEDFKKVQLFNVARIVLVNAMVLTALYFTLESDHALIRLKYSVVIEALIIAGFSFFYIRKMDFTFDKQIASKTIRIAFPVLISGVLGIFINLSDRYFIEKYGSLRDMSIYNLAVAFSGIVPFVFASFQNIWLPQFLKEKDFRSNRAKSKKITFRLVILFSLISLAVLGTLKLMLWSNIIDQKYDAIMPLLPIVLVTSVVASITPMYSNHLIYLDKLYLIILVGIPIAIIGVTLNSQLVPRYNVYGAAISALVMSSCYLIAYSFFVNHFYNKKLAVAQVDDERSA